jgi:hypothetical protein
MVIRFAVSEERALLDSRAAAGAALGLAAAAVEQGRLDRGEER